jgi:hypothetical protein
MEQQVYNSRISESSKGEKQNLNPPRDIRRYEVKKIFIKYVVDFEYVIK